MWNGDFQDSRTGTTYKKYWKGNLESSTGIECHKYWRGYIVCE